MSDSPARSEIAAVRFSWRLVFGLAFLCLLAFLARAFECRTVFPDGRFSPLGTDPFYHMRRVWMTIAHYPRVEPFFDSYIAYPLGGVIIWPPLFDFSIATLAMIVGLGHPGPWVVEHVAAFFPPVVGAATVVPVYFLTRHLFGKKCALLASAITAILPASVSISVVGRVDHHVLEVFLSTCFLLAMTKALAGGRRMTWIAGVLLGLTFLAWHGSNLFVAVIVCLYAVRLMAGYCSAEDAKALLSSTLPVLGVALLFLLPYARQSVWVDSTVVRGAPMEQQPPLPYMGLSVFHVGFVLLSIVFVCYGYILARGFRRWNAGGLPFALAFAGLPLLVLFAIYLSGLAGRLSAVIAYLGQKDPWLSTVAECQPLFSYSGKIDTSFAEVAFGYGIYVFPIALLIIILCLTRRARGRRELALFVVWSVVISCLVLAKKRFIGEFAICFAIALSYVTLAIATRIRGIRALQPWVEKAAWVGFAGVAALSVLPAISYFVPLSKRLHRSAPRLRTMPGNYREAMDFLREQTPPTSYYEEPTRKPEYGVLAEWKCGEWIQYVARRPVLANCMGTHQGRARPFRDSVRFLFLEQEEEAVGLLKRDNVRFVMTTYFAKNLPNYLRIAGVELSRYAAMRAEGSRSVMSLKWRYFRTMGARLHERDGAVFRIDGTGEWVPPLKHFRLIYEGPRDEEVNVAWNIPSLKIFEFVDGARLSGRAHPGAKVAARVDVTTNRGRTFRYVTFTSALQDGSFELVLPYSTTGCLYRTHAVAPYTILSGTASMPLDVPEEALNGRIVTCDLTGAGLPK